MGEVTNPWSRLQSTKRGLGQYFFNFEVDVLVVPAQNPKRDQLNNRPPLEQISPHQLHSLQLANPTLENRRSQAEGMVWESSVGRMGCCTGNHFGGEGGLPEQDLLIRTRSVLIQDLLISKRSVNKYILVIMAYCH